MTRHRSPSTHQSFFEIARRLKLLDDPTLQSLETEVAQRGQSPGELVLQKGLLSAVQLDIVETLRRPTETVPGYEILDVAGQGGMGVVYRARQLNLDRIVALKTMLVSQLEDQSVASRFEREARTVARLRHPNIVGAYDIGRHEGRLFLVMEYIEGDDASQWIQRTGGLPEAATWGLIRQTAAGLAHAAAKEVVHRDIKPANLLLVAPPEGSQLPAGLPMVKIADFGLAYLRGEVERSVSSAERIVGSPNYMAPEQLQQGDVDRRADIYALGASAYHMLAGEPPFAGQTLTQILSHKIGGEVPPLPAASGISDASKQLVRRLMARDPQDRILDYGPLIEAIDQLPQTEQTLVLPEKTSSALSAAGTEPTEVLPRYGASGEAGRDTPPSTTTCVGCSIGRLAAFALGCHTVEPPPPSGRPGLRPFWLGHVPLRWSEPPGLDPRLDWSLDGGEGCRRCERTGRQRRPSSPCPRPSGLGRDYDAAELQVDRCRRHASGPVGRSAIWSSADRSGTHRVFLVAVDPQRPVDR